jgi:lipoprotein-anchoring transpeptidase ErfK/SrfK
VCALVAAVLTTLVTLLAGVGVLPAGPSPAAAATPQSGDKASLATQTFPGTARSLATPAPATVPDGTGWGKRIVFDISDQRVWLVDPGEEVRRTYLVSGSVTDNLRPGTYAVYSRSRWAVGVDDSGVMQYFVRFTRGDNAAIGFHSIPTKNGRALQTRAQLGTPQSHGCIRQALPDAITLWNFAPVGTKVVVTA